MFGRDVNVFFHAAEHAQFGLDRDALFVGPLHDAPGGGDIFIERLVRGVDHHRRVKPTVDAVVADFFGAVIQMDGEDRLGKHIFSGADHDLPEIACP